MQAREAREIQAFTFVTDESPASALRYQGLRFQITVVYFVKFLPVSEWEDQRFDDKPPCTRHKRLCDVRNCAGKKGDDVFQVVVKQWERLGCYKEDCVGGTGDAGGENEGAHGLHSLLEEVRPDYVRRRCLAHLPWRCADQVLNAIGDHHESIKAISYYLHDGGTWNRLKSIAVQAPLDGGLGLLTDGTPAYHDIFGKAPPRNMGERPDTTAALLEWLQPRAAMLARLVQHDAATRDLAGRQNALARATLQDVKDTMYRRIIFVCLKKSMYVYYHIEKEEHVSTHTSLPTLFEAATQVMTSTEADERVLELLGLPVTYLADQGIRPDIHWVDLALNTTPNMSDAERASHHDDAHELHTKIVFQAQGHLGLNLINIFRTTWTAAALLNPDPESAQESANRLLWAPSVGLLRLRPDQCTQFERAMLQSDVLMRELEQFAAANPPVRL